MPTFGLAWSRMRPSDGRPSRPPRSASVRQSPRPMYMTQPLSAIERPCDSPLVARPVAVGPALIELGAAVVGVDRRLAVAAHEAGGPLERAEQVLAEVVLGVGGLDAAHAGVEGAAAAVVAAPRDRVIGAADGRAVAGRRVDARGSARRCGPCPSGGVSTCTRGRCGSTAAAGRAWTGARGRRGRRPASDGVGRVVVRARADQAVDEARARLDGRGRADAEEALAVLDEALQRRLTGGVEHVAADVEEDERLVALELGRVDVGRRPRPRSTVKSFASPSALMALYARGVGGVGRRP